MCDPADQELETDGGRFPLQEYRLRQGGREWTVLHAGTVLSHVDEARTIVKKTNQVPYGISLWPSAIALAHEIASRPEAFRDRGVLELGAGTGLPGIVAASLGSRVVQTDHQELVLQLCRSNGGRNGVEGIEYRLADWTRWEDAGRYDWILGSDILYVEEEHLVLHRIFETSLAAGGRLLLSDPFREKNLRMLGMLEGDGWGVTVSRWDVGEGSIPRPVGVFELAPRSPSALATATSTATPSGVATRRLNSLPSSRLKDKRAHQLVANQPRPCASGRSGMDTRKMAEGPMTRRSFLGGTATFAACAMVPRGVPGAAADRPNSVFGGVRIGVNTYSYRGEIFTAEDTLRALIEDGLSEVELKERPIQSFTGLSGVGPKTPKLADSQREAILAKCVELRTMYNDAGVNIHVHKIPFGQTDEAIDFNFQIAKALGCMGITLERSDSAARRLAPFADRHKIWLGLHNHTENTPSLEKDDPILDYSPFIGFNLDVGHYFAGTKGKSPIPAIEKYHERIVSLHLKDRTADGKNLPWGTGQTPIKEVLRLMKREKWNFPADIELEYKIPAGSSAVAEVAKCVRYCKEALA